MPKRIMVINDTQEILELFEEILRDEGYEVVLFSFSVNDLEEVIRVKPDLLILDYAIGREEQGWQLLQKMKMCVKTASIPIIVCTTATKLVLEIQGFLASKQIALVPKPFDIEDLLSAVKKALDIPASAGD